MRAAATAEALAYELTDPPQPSDPLTTQSLADGAAGIALLHIERARAGLGDYDLAHSFIAAATSHAVTAAPSAGMYIGLPTLSFLLNLAARDDQQRYAAARKALASRLDHLTHQRAQQAAARMSSGRLPTFSEYDLLYGMSGIAAVLLCTAPGSDALGAALDYLVTLTHPLTVDHREVPGWWVGHDPNRGTSEAFPGGHGNLGIAHGITGPLTVLSVALREGITVDYHREAIANICEHLDAQRRSGPIGHWWPQWVTLGDERIGNTDQTGPWRPSWCYGTPGIARAQQLAGIATGDVARQRIAEDALAACLADSEQLRRLGDGGLCHGVAGVYQTVVRAAADARNPAIGHYLTVLAELLIAHAQSTSGEQPGFLTGRAGTALALHTAAYGTSSIGWDTCLLLD